MNLAGKLNRLRQLRGESAQSAELTNAAAADAQDALSARLRRLRPPTPADKPCVASLAERLGMQNLDGLLVATQRVPLSFSRHDDLSALPSRIGHANADWVYLDTETTGLSSGVGNQAFMVGAARLVDGDRLEVRQFLLASFAAEHAMLQQLLDWLGDSPVLVSYNGKCFDLPLLLSRCRLHRVDSQRLTAPHLDLMYPTRRAFRRIWSDCRLQTAERELLALHRVDDLPGAMAPLAWQDWLRHGDVNRLAGALAHNFQDVVSLALLHRKLIDVYAGAGTESTFDAYAVAKAWVDAGEPERGRALLESFSTTLCDRGSHLLATLSRRVGNWDVAERIWRDLQANGDQQAALALSKYYEHRRRDLPLAYALAVASPAEEREARLRRIARKLHGPQQLPLKIG